MGENAEKKLACNCCFGEEYPSLHGTTIIGCTEDNIWCNDFIAEKCEQYVDKNNVVLYETDDGDFVYNNYIPDEYGY